MLYVMREKRTGLFIADTGTRVKDVKDAVCLSFGLVTAICSYYQDNQLEPVAVIEPEPTANSLEVRIINLEKVVDNVWDAIKKLAESVSFKGHCHGQY